MHSEINVLLVEDEQQDADLILRQIHKAGYKVQHTIVDAPEALQNALQQSKWDIIISDYNIPGFGGLQALEIVKSSNTDIPFILISGNMGEDVAVKTIKDGASDYLMKNNLARLGNVIKNELEAASSRKDRQLLDQALNQISVAIAGSSIENFLSTILLQLSNTLQSDYAFVGLINKGAPDHMLQTICVCENGQIAANFNYSSKDTPCEDVLQNKVVLLPNDVMALYPDNKSFNEKKIEGYIGVPLNNAAGKIFGILVLMYKEPVKAGRIKTSILRLYSSRVAAEIERSQFHQALKASEQRFAAIFRNSPVGISLTSAKEGIFLDVNDIFLEKTGYERVDIIGKNSLELNLYKNIEDRNFIRENVLKKGSVTNMECEVLAKGGNSFFCLISVSVVKIEDADYMLSSIIDINDRKIALDKLLESEAKVSAYFNSTTEATVMVDGCSKIMVFNKLYEDYVRAVFKAKVAPGDMMQNYLQTGHEQIFFSQYQYCNDRWQRPC